MFKPIKGGTKVDIPDAFGHPFECWVPPLGYGYNPDTGEMAETDIIKRSTNKFQQYWEREDLPDWYESKRVIEEDRQRFEEDYIDYDCETIRETHWRRRLYGCWFYNNGVPTYITGLHWFTLNWWKFQGKYFDFRIPNMEFFYVIDYCIEDHNCLGDIEITKRKEGKTARAGAFIYEYVSRTGSKHGGIQSKTDLDAKEVFKKAITNPFTKLPHFFVPKFDATKGDDPDKTLRFFNPSRKTLRARKEKREEALESFIDFKPSGVYAYDGPELHRYVSDESGKLEKISIVDRHNVVQFCSEVDGEFVGKHHYTTTVEDMESGGSEFQRLVKMSDRRELDANGRTKTGLYVYFLPAFRTLYYDQYGFPDEEKAKQYYLNRRAALINDPRELSSFIRKNPFSLNEAFRVDGEKSLWNPEKLNEQLDWLSWKKDELVERGNFEWVKGERLTEVEWVKNKAGRFQMPIGFKMTSPNKVVTRNGKFFPDNNFSFRAGCDPFKYDKAKDNRRSDCAAFIGKMFDAANPNDFFNDAAICRYRFRAATTTLSNEDILKMVWYFGCQILFERNVDHWKQFFTENGCEAFLMKLPGEDEYGIYSDGHGNMLQAICDLIENHIENSYKKILFIETVKELLEFDVGNTTAFDETIAFGLLRVAMKNKKYRRTHETTHDITRYFRTYKAS
jgi:hypothetical protein